MQTQSGRLLVLLVAAVACGSGCGAETTVEEPRLWDDTRGWGLEASLNLPEDHRIPVPLPVARSTGLRGRPEPETRKLVQLTADGALTVDRVSVPGDGDWVRGGADVAWLRIAATRPWSEVAGLLRRFADSPDRVRWMELAVLTFDEGFVRGEGFFALRPVPPLATVSDASLAIRLTRQGSGGFFYTLPEEEAAWWFNFPVQGLVDPGAKPSEWYEEERWAHDVRRLFHDVDRALTSLAERGYDLSTVRIEVSADEEALTLAFVIALLDTLHAKVTRRVSFPRQDVALEFVEPGPEKPVKERTPYFHRGEPLPSIPTWAYVVSAIGVAFAIVCVFGPLRRRR